MTKPLSRVLASISLVWLVLVILVPNIVDEDVIFFGTIALITFNFIVSSLAYLAGKKTLVALCVTQLALFGMLHWRLYWTIAAEFYACEHLGRDPGFLDWSMLVGGHVLRAADVPDIIDAYDIDLHHVRHNHWLPGMLLVYMHIVVDAFLLGLVTTWIKQKLARPTEESVQDAAKRQDRYEKILRARDYSFSLLLAVCAGTALWQGWRFADWILWPLDNFLRLVDVGDAFHVFRWQLHEVQQNYWTTTLAVLLRVFMGLYLVQWFFTAVRGCMTIVILLVLGLVIYFWVTNREDFKKEFKKKENFLIKAALQAQKPGPF